MFWTQPKCHVTCYGATLYHRLSEKGITRIFCCQYTSGDKQYAKYTAGKNNTHCNMKKYYYMYYTRKALIYITYLRKLKKSWKRIFRNQRKNIYKIKSIYSELIGVFVLEVDFFILSADNQIKATLVYCTSIVKVSNSQFGVWF